ncbi:MAG: hypothetical protein J6T83_01210 [Paludibacteraceae bacterium]|nr:hypothetical protein [Paludibacteraceae bacterium]
MKTQEFLEELRKKNIRVPKGWAIMQSSSGHFLGFMPSGMTNAEAAESCREFTDIACERIRAEREAARNSKLLEL